MTTATRVSSRWRPSINILVVIYYSPDARLAKTAGPRAILTRGLPGQIARGMADAMGGEMEG
ncbi:MAG: hypothetical protein ACRCSO_08505 [Sphingomonas sp.]